MYIRFCLLLTLLISLSSCSTPLKWYGVPVSSKLIADQLLLRTTIGTKYTSIYNAPMSLNIANNITNNAYTPLHYLTLDVRNRWRQENVNNNQSIIFHQLRKKESIYDPNNLNLTKKSYQYSVIAFLVSDEDNVVDWAYGVFSTPIDCFSILTNPAQLNRDLSEYCNKETLAAAADQAMQSLVTSDGNAVETWR